jgi:hypothetical protein
MASTPSDAEPPARRRRLDQARENATRAAAWARERVPWMSLVEQALERERISAAGLLAGGLAYRLFFSREFHATRVRDQPTAKPPFVKG